MIKTQGEAIVKLTDKLVAAEARCSQAGYEQLLASSKGLFEQVVAEQKETARYKELLKKAEGQETTWFQKHHELSMKYEQDKEIWHRATATFRNKSKVYTELFT